MPDIKPVLADYMSKEDFAREIKSHPRTVDNYRKLPDGLPSVMIAGRVYIPIEAGREWIARRIVYPNPTRKAG